MGVQSFEGLGFRGPLGCGTRLLQGLLGFRQGPGHERRWEDFGYVGLIGLNKQSTHTSMNYVTIIYHSTQYQLTEY